MVYKTEEGLQRTMDRLCKTAREYDMKINAKKTKTMVVSKTEATKLSIKVDGKEIEQVAKFKYLGAILSEDGRNTEDVKVRIGMAKDPFNQRRELMTKSFNKSVKKRIVNTMVWSVAKYACTTWTLRKEEINRLNVFEMWIMEKNGKGKLVRDEDK